MEKKSLSISLSVRVFFTYNHKKETKIVGYRVAKQKNILRICQEEEWSKEREL